MTAPTGSDAMRLAEQWELARCVYAWHQVLKGTQGSPSYSAAAKQLDEATQRFVAAGGIAETGIGPLGDKGPKLSLADGRVVPYTAGQALVAACAKAIHR